MKLSSLRSFTACIAVLALVACDKAPQQAAQPQQPPPPEVTVVAAHEESLPETKELVGRLAPTRVAQVRARVTGIVLKRAYTEGTDVEQGQQLFQIDPKPLEAQVHVQEAALAQAKASAANAAQTAQRYRDLNEKKLISQQDLDNALATERSTAAAVQQAEANLELARLNLGYASVEAPISGRAGEALVTEGALVSQGDATKMTTIEQIDPIYVNFSLPSNDVADIQRAAMEARAGSGGEAPQSTTRITVLLPDGKPFKHSGVLDYLDLSVDPNTGTTSMRGIVPNPERTLLPGMFVKIKLTLGTLAHAFSLPQATVQRDARGAYVLVVDSQGKVEQKRVDTHGLTQTNWVVTGDLADGDQVIVDGIQKVQPGGQAKAVLEQAGNGGQASEAQAE